MSVIKTFVEFFNDPVAGSSPERAWIARGVLCAPILIAVVLFVGENSYSLYDDTYIYFRYVENIYRGCGMRFNCADAPVEGFTSPLWLMVLLASRTLSADLETSTQLLGPLFTVLALSTVVLTANHPSLCPEHPKLRFALSLAASVAFSLDHIVLLNAVTGMETALTCFVAALLFRALLLDQRRRLPWIALLLWLCRPEGALFLVCVPLYLGPRAWRRWLPALGVCGLLLALRFWVFHDLLPNTFYAKSGGTHRHLVLGARYLLDTLREAPLIALAPLSVAIPSLRRSAGLWLAVTTVWFLFMLRTGGDSFLYSRLPAPLIAPLVALGLHGLCALGLRAVSKPLLAPALLCLALLSVPLGWRTHRFTGMHSIPDVARWARVGRYLRVNHPGATVAVVPIGAIAYFSGARVIDLVGLTSREIAHARRSIPPERLNANWIGHERHNTEYVLAQRPDIIIFARHRATPWTDLRQAIAGFWAEWLLLREIKEGRAPYVLYSAPVAPRTHWLMFVRSDLVRPNP